MALRARSTAHINPFHRKRPPARPSNDLRNPRTNLPRICLSRSFTVETRNRQLAERGTYYLGKSIGRTRSPSFQRYRSIIRHRRRYTRSCTHACTLACTRVRANARQRGILHLFAHASNSAARSQMRLAIKSPCALARGSQSRRDGDKSINATRECRCKRHLSFTRQYT